ncbi:MAG: trypsin-like peptidase domain-containing protein [Deltaproteobacteria bacterium]|nr:trypsin-like peptidase domain-containing protein [Deltaproteobacteria bacterium]
MTKNFIRILPLNILLYLTAIISYALTPDEENTVSVYKKASAGVVNITSIALQMDFFRGIIPLEGAGSGVIIDSNGNIITNNHVIKDAQRIEVTLSDGSKSRGELIGTDSYNDLAVIRIEAPPDILHPVPLGNSSNLQAGQKVIAIGNPFGLQQTVTTGIISSIGRSITAQDGTTMDNLIQTDAAINPGNSGGPLLDSEGNLVGINTAIFSPSGGSVGIGFAIPIDTVKRIIPDLLEKGYVPHPWLGVTMFPLIPGLARELGLKVDRGAMIIKVIKDGPSDKAGLRGANKILYAGNAMLPVGGDIIVAIEDTVIFSSEELIRYLYRYRPDDKVRLKILRDGDFMELAVTLGEMPRQWDEIISEN